MVGINRTRWKTHPVQEEKMNLFVDYFNYCVHFMGTLHYMELDTPISLLDKGLFQLKYNSSEKKFIYITNHFEKFLAEEEDFLKLFKGHAELKIIIRDFLSKSTNNKIKLLANPLSLFRSINEFKEELDKEMFSLALNNLVKFILCPHSVQEHREGIIFYTKLIAAHLILTRKSKAEVQSLFAEIFTKEYNEFPFPESIKTDEEKRNYFNTKTIKEVLLAIGHFSERKPKQWHLLFKLDGIELPKAVDFSHAESNLTSLKHKSLGRLREMISKQKDDFIKKRLEGIDWSICQVAIKSVTRDGAYRDALNLARSTVDFINSVLNKNFVLNKETYFFTSDGIHYGYKLIGGNSQTHHVLTDFDLQKLNNNAYNVLRPRASQATDAFLKFEKDFIKAKETSNIASMWRYLEVLLSDASDGKKVKDIVSGTLLLNEKEFITREITDYLKNAINVFNSSNEDLGITPDEQLFYSRSATKLKELNEKIPSVFFKTAYKELTSKITLKRYITIRDVYISILTEAYEQRNFSEHNGKHNPYANTKLIHTFLLMVVRFRWVLFDYMKRYRTATFPEILKKIRMDYSKKVSVSIKQK